MTLAVLAVLAGMLSVLAPCVLPVLPVIMGGGLAANKRYRPLIIITSTAVCITVFTAILKASTLLIMVPESFWLGVSAAIIILYGATLIRPELRDRVAQTLGLHRANRLAARAKQHNNIGGDILLGASLGPIFASCSPTYALLLSLVFPQNFTLGIMYTLLYALGFAVLLLLITYGGRAIVHRLHRAADSQGTFKKILGIILIITGVLIATGWMKKLEVALLDAGFLDVTKVEQRILDALDDDMMPTQEQEQANPLFNRNIPAPEFVGLQNWINTAGWDSIMQLRGKVVLIDFWTYSCINCIRTLPYLRQRHQEYADDGLVIIGIHAPEFQFEKDINNVKKAVRDYNLLYPVVQDNDFQTRSAYGNRYRPAKYIIDRSGVVRYSHFGEGKYEETEQVIQALLGLSGTISAQDTARRSYPITAETYLGLSRAIIGTGQPDAGYVNAESTDATYFSQVVTTQRLNTRRLKGARQFTDEYVATTSNAKSSLFLNYQGKSVKAVMGSEFGMILVDVLIDKQYIKTLKVEANQLYDLFEGDNSDMHTLELRVSGRGLQVYTFVFG